MMISRVAQALHEPFSFAFHPSYQLFVKGVSSYAMFGSCESVECRIRPLLRFLCQTMLHRIIVDVLNVTIQIQLITKTMLPKPTLPNVTFSASPPRGTRQNSRFDACRYRPGKAGFDQTPARRKISIPFRQPPDAMKMIG